MGTAVSSPEKNWVFVNDCCAPAELSSHPDSLEPFHHYARHIRVTYGSISLREVPSKKVFITRKVSNVYSIDSIRSEAFRKKSLLT